MKFVGASKGNPGHAGYGGIFRSIKGRILRIYRGQIGINTNNAVEIHTLEEGLCITESQGYD
jgi:ribonuclease HI